MGESTNPVLRCDDDDDDKEQEESEENTTISMEKKHPPLICASHTGATASMEHTRLHDGGDIGEGGNRVVGEEDLRGDLLGQACDVRCAMLGPRHVRGDARRCQLHAVVFRNVFTVITRWAGAGSPKPSA